MTFRFKPAEDEMTPPEVNRNLFGGAALIGVATLIWDKLKMVMHKFVSLIVVTSTFRGECKTMLTFYVMQKMKRSKFADKTFWSARKYVRPLRRFTAVIYETVGTDPILAFCGRSPILISYNANHETVQISFIRGTVQLDQLILQIETHFNHFSDEGFSKNRRFNVRRKYGSVGRMFSQKQLECRTSEAAIGKSPDSEAWMMGRLVSWKLDEVGEGMPVSEKAMQSLAYPPEIQRTFDGIVQWKSSESWYKERGIPWKRGLLLHGAPGTGKSAFVRAVGIDLDMPIFILDIGTMTNEEFVDAWEAALAIAPVIVLIEDMDAVFKGRKRLSEASGGLTFDCLLSRISGVENSDGVILFITTNDLGSIDPAIGQVWRDGTSRPGRIDLIIQFSEMREPDRLRLAKMVMKGMPESVIAMAVQDGAGETAAQFQTRCAKMALDFYWYPLVTEMSVREMVDGFQKWQETSRIS